MLDVSLRLRGVRVLGVVEDPVGSWCCGWRRRGGGRLPGVRVGLLAGAGVSAAVSAGSPDPGAGDGADLGAATVRARGVRWHACGTARRV